MAEPFAHDLQRYAGHEAARAAWHDQHADTHTYRDQLARQIDDRRLDLGRQAAIDQPDHLTKMLGPYPDRHPARDRWMFAAARIEAYREEWGVEPPTSTGHPPTASNTATGSTSSTPHDASKHSADPRQREGATYAITASKQGFGIEL